MSFYTKYQELGLRDIDLISWLEFNSNSNDSGPNNNDWTLETAEGSLYANIGSAEFSGQRLHLSDYSPLSFTAFFDAEKWDSFENQSLLSSSMEGGKFMFGWAASGAFYISVVDDNSAITAVRFFKKLEPSKRAIFSLSKFENVFFLYLYDPFSDELEMDQLTIPYELFYEGNELDLGSTSFEGIGEDSNFTLNEFSLINNGVPGFCVLELCREIWNNNSDFNFKFSWLAVNNLDESLFEGIENSNKNNTGLILPYSLSPEGYSLLGYSSGPDTRVFVDGDQITPSFNSGYITFADLDSENIVVADFFDGTQDLPADVYFFGATTCIMPKGGVPVYSGPTFKRLSSGFKHISEINMCYGEYISFPSTENLVEI